MMTLILQYILLGVWLFTGYQTVTYRKVLPLNLFGIMLILNVIMIYIITTNLTIDEYFNILDGTRIEWFVVDFLVAIIVLKVINISRRINKTLKCFTYKSKTLPDD